MKKLIIIMALMLSLNFSSEAYVFYSRTATGGGNAGYYAGKVTEFNMVFFGFAGFMEIGVCRIISCKDPGHSECPTVAPPANGNPTNPSDESAIAQLVPLAFQNGSNNGSHAIDIASGLAVYRYTVLWQKYPNGDSIISIDKVQLS